MKLLKTVPAAVVLAGACLRQCMRLPMIPFLLSWMILRLRRKRLKVISTGIPGAVRKYQKFLSDSRLHHDWYGKTTAWSLWGNASNTSSNDERSSEKYAVGGRSRYNLTDYDYIFGRASWLTDRYNGYCERDVLTAGYGRQFLNGPVHSFRFEFGLVCVTTNIQMIPAKHNRWVTHQVLMHGN